MILDAASAVIANNRNRKKKALWTDLKGGAKIKLLPRRRRARRGRIHHAASSRKALEDDYKALTAVLYRTNAQSRAVEDSLRAAGIAYVVLGGVGFYERREIKDALVVPEADPESARRHRAAAGDQRAGARHRQGRDGRARRRGRLAGRHRPAAAAGRASSRPSRTNSLWTKLVTRRRWPAADAAAGAPRWRRSAI